MTNNDILIQQCSNDQLTLPFPGNRHTDSHVTTYITAGENQERLSAGSTESREAIKLLIPPISFCAICR
jgi:hypothetical protein